MGWMGEENEQVVERAFAGRGNGSEAGSGGLLGMWGGLQGVLAWEFQVWQVCLM